MRTLIAVYIVLIATNLFAEDIFIYPEKYEHVDYSKCQVPIGEAQSECDSTTSIKAKYLFDLNNDGICELFVSDEPCFGNGGPFYHIFEWHNGRLRLIGAVNPDFWLAKSYNGFAQIMYLSYFGHKTNPSYTVAIQRYDGKQYQFLQVPEISYGGYADLGMKYYKKHDYKNAGIYFLNLYRMKRENDINSANDLALTWIKLHKYEQAENLLIKQIAVSSDRKGMAAAYFNIGLIYEETKRLEKALSAFTQSSELAPNTIRRKKVEDIQHLINTSRSDAPFSFAAQKKYQVNMITLSYPDDWELQSGNNNSQIKLRPKDWMRKNVASEIETDDFAVYITIYDQDLTNAAASAGFSKKETRWKLEGRHGAEADVEEIKGKSWEGIMGEAPVGLYYKKGGYAGLGWETTAVVSNGKRSAVLRGSEIEQILNSIEFINDK